MGDTDEPMMPGGWDHLQEQRLKKVRAMRARGQEPYPAHVSRTHTAAEAVAGLRGRLWERTVEKAEVAKLSESLTLVSTRLVAGRTRVRVLADAAPGAAFLPAEPELEDVYFAVRRGAVLQSRAA